MRFSRSPILFLAMFAAAPAIAQDVSDLVGARGSSGEMELQNRGFAIAKQSGLTSFWWNPDTSSCVRVVTANGRYQTVAPTSAAACGKTAGSSSSSSSSTTASSGAAKAQMPRFCKGAAAEKFGQSPQNISTQMPVADHGMYSVFGQFPPNGAGTVFICTFTRDGKLVGVDRE